MASICLYDIDFLHGAKFSINLELMKIFNYYYTQGHKVRLAKKNDTEEWYDQKIFFLQNPKCRFPQKLKLTGDNITLYGYGFYKDFKDLKKEIKAVPPSFMVYDTSYDLIKNKNIYEKIKDSSLIRVENRDFSYYNPNKKALYVADYDFFSVSNNFEFLEEYSKHNISFLWGLRAKDKDTFLKLFRYLHNVNRRIVIDFDYDVNFFKTYYNENIMFLFDSEKEKDLLKIIQMILYAKNKNQILFLEQSSKPILSNLSKWSSSKDKISFYDYCINNNKKDWFINNFTDRKELRLLLRQNPQFFDTQNLDF